MTTGGSGKPMPPPRRRPQGPPNQAALCHAASEDSTASLYERVLPRNPSVQSPRPVRPPPPIPTNRSPSSHDQNRVPGFKLLNEGEEKVASPTASPGPSPGPCSESSQCSTQQEVLLYTDVLPEGMTLTPPVPHARTLFLPKPEEIGPRTGPSSSTSDSPGSREGEDAKSTPPPLPRRLTLGLPSRAPVLQYSVSVDPHMPLYEEMVLPRKTPLGDKRLQRAENVYSSSPSHPLLHQRSMPDSYPLGTYSQWGTCNTEELDILMDWWHTVAQWEHLPIDYQHNEEEAAKVFTTEAQRVHMGLRLFELLMDHRQTTLMNHITELHCIASNLDKVYKNARIAGITGGATGAVGGAAIIAGIALAPFTLGASLVVAGVGAGVAVAGGVTGASAAITNKVNTNQDRKKVEKVLKDYKSQMEDIECCLKFINTGMEHLRKHDLSSLKGVDTEAVRVARVAEVAVSAGAMGAISQSSGVLQGFALGMDFYFTKEDTQKLKKGSETKFAKKVREVAKQLKSGIDELIWVKNMFRSAANKI